MNRTPYSEKLRDPRWQKMRLKVMERDDFTCQRCYDKESTLNVHHNYYEAGKAPWEYPEVSLVTLCEMCHEDETNERPIAERSLLNALKVSGFSYADIYILADAFKRVQPRPGASILSLSLFDLLSNKEWLDRLVGLHHEFKKELRSAVAAARPEVAHDSKK